MEFGGRLPVALVFPGKASLALSTLGWQAVYRLLCSHPGFAVERFYCETGAQKLVSEESGRDIGEFAVVAFSINFELDLLPLARSLKLANLLPESRRPAFPLVLGGGPLAFLNPAPLAKALDLVFCGEAGDEFLALMLAVKGAADLGITDKQALLATLATMPGAYVPGLSPLPVRRIVASDSLEMSATPEKPDKSEKLVPGEKLGKHGRPRELATPAVSAFVSREAEFKDMFLIEANRGCPRACRFCAAGFVYRPPRQASLDTIKRAVLEAAPRKIGLVGTALADWPDLQQLLAWLNEQGIKFGLSSLRAAGLTAELVATLRRSGSRTLTLALEGPSQRLRDAANKHLSEAQFLRAVELCADEAVEHLKIYLIVGWPGETDEDYREFAAMVGKVAQAARLGLGKKSVGHVTFAVSSLVPKAFTPLQFAPMASEADLEAAVERVKSAVKPFRAMRVSADSPFAARIQGLIARGGEDAFDLALAALKHGESWRKGLAAWSGDQSFIDYEHAPDEPFPWEVIDIGVSKSHLAREWERFKLAALSPPCPAKGCQACKGCGVDGFIKRED